MPLPRGLGTLLAILPPLTLGAAIAATEISSVESAWVDTRLGIAMLVAVIAPICGTIAARLVSPGVDAVLVAIANMLLAIGAGTLHVLAKSSGLDSEFYTAIATRHGLFIGLGAVGLVAGVFSERYLERMARYPFSILGAALVLTVVTFLFGESVNGARLWLQAGPIRFQPSEFARFLIATFAAIYLFDRRHLVSFPWRIGSLDLPPLPYLLPLAGAILAAAAVLVFQNDLGMAALVILGAFASVVSVVSSRGALVMVTGVLAIAVSGAYFTVSRVRDRVAGWLDPWQDPAGRGFQFVQAEYALAAGGMAGDGRALRNQNVPEVHTDLILVAIGNQLGWFATSAALALSGLLICRCVLAAIRGRDEWRSLFAFSISALLGIQVLLIVGGTLRVLPLTGLTLPLLSYGGSSMIVTMFALGLVAGIGAATPPRKGLAMSGVEEAPSIRNTLGRSATNREAITA